MGEIKEVFVPQSVGEFIEHNRQAGETWFTATTALSERLQFGKGQGTDKEVFNWFVKHQGAFVAAYRGKFIVKDTTPKFYGWINSLTYGQKRYLTKTSVPGLWKESEYLTKEAIEAIPDDLIHLKDRHQFSPKDRSALPKGWDRLVNWERV